MFVDQVAFFLTITVFFVLTIYIKLKETFFKSRINPNTAPSQPPFQNTTLRTTLNSYAGFNSVVICIGFITETYLYGARLLFNLLSVSIGYIVAFVILHPVVHGLDTVIKSPYEYLSQRYGDRRLMRVVPALCGLFFYLLFMSLHLWGCSVVLATILPQIPNLYVSTIVVGVFALTGSLLFGGFAQSLSMNLVQLAVLMSGLVAALVSTFGAGRNGKSVTDLWSMAQSFGRLKFVDTSGDLRTRYTVWNQTFSLPIPWVCVHLLMQPSFSKYRSIKGTFKHFFTEIVFL